MCRRNKKTVLGGPLAGPAAGSFYPRRFTELRFGPC